MICTETLYFGDGWLLSTHTSITEYLIVPGAYSMILTGTHTHTHTRTRARVRTRAYAHVHVATPAVRRTYVQV